MPPPLFWMGKYYPYNFLFRDKETFFKIFLILLHTQWYISSILHRGIARGARGADAPGCSPEGSAKITFFSPFFVC